MKKIIKLGLVTTMLSLFMTVAVMAAPAKTENVHQTAADESSITVEWNAQLGSGIHYEIEMSTDGKNFECVEKYAVGTTDNTYNLNAGTTYYLRMRAVQSNQYGEYSDVITVATAPKNVENLKQTTATTTSISLSWDKADGATSYQVWGYDGTVNKKLVTTSKNSATINGLSNKNELNYEYIYVRSVRKVGEFEAVDDTTASYAYVSFSHIASYDIKLIPQKVTGVNVTDYYFYGKSVYIGFNALKADNVKCQVYNNKNKLVTSGETYSTTYSHNISFGNIGHSQWYKTRMAGYVVVNNKKLSGKWSDWCYFAQSPEVQKITKSKKGLGIKWGKIKGTKRKEN
jgi:hypothetical protein